MVRFLALGWATLAGGFFVGAALGFALEAIVSLWSSLGLTASSLLGVSLLLTSSLDASLSLPMPIVDESRGGGFEMIDVYNNKNAFSYLLSSLLRYIWPQGRMWLQSHCSYDKKNLLVEMAKMLVLDSINVGG
jgi:hypothetical protein